MKKFAIVLGIAFAILVGSYAGNMFTKNTTEPTKAEVVDVVETLDTAVTYANSELGYSGKVAYAKLAGMCTDSNYNGTRFDIKLYDANGNVIGYTSVGVKSMAMYAK